MTLPAQAGLDPKVETRQNGAMLRNARTRLGIIGELFHFLWEARLWWLVPMIVTLVLFGILIVFAETSAISPFVYTLF